MQHLPKDYFYIFPIWKSLGTVKTTGIIMGILEQLAILYVSSIAQQQQLIIPKKKKENYAK